VEKDWYFEIEFGRKRTVYQPVEPVKVTDLGKTTRISKLTKTMRPRQTSVCKQTGHTYNVIATSATYLHCHGATDGHEDKAYC